MSDHAKNPALTAILTGITDAAERERITNAYHSLSEGDERSFPVVFALVSNATALSIAESADRVEKAIDVFIEHKNQTDVNSTAASSIATPVARQRKAQRTDAQLKSNASSGASLLVPILVALFVSGVSLASGYALMSRTFAAREEANAQHLERTYTEAHELISDLRSAGGGLRYYNGKDVRGNPVRVLTLDGGLVKPTNAFLTETDTATIILPPLKTP